MGLAFDKTITQASHAIRHKMYTKEDAKIGSPAQITLASSRASHFVTKRIHRTMLFTIQGDRASIYPVIPKGYTLPFLFYRTEHGEGQMRADEI
jgi:hypothetical protein